jgi:cardiolipin synthase
MTIAIASIKCISSSSDFLAQLRYDILRATDRVWIQCMSFEGDAIGQELTELVINSSAHSKRLMVDSYSKIVHNDSVLAFPLAWFNFPLVKERYQTTQCWKKMKSNNVSVQFTNPLGIFGIKYPMRNHKKMIIIDNNVYIGGRNFCDHNFKWHDMMVKINIQSVTDFLVKDFDATWRGENSSDSFESESIKGWSLNGLYSTHDYIDILNRIASAKKRIDLFSPYISGPFLRHLCHKAREKSIELKLYIPEINNKSIITGYLNYYQQRFPLTLCYVSGEMSHTKAIIVDDRTVFFGSSNFDFISYSSEQEILFEFNDDKIVALFKKELFNSLRWEEKATPTTSKVRQHVSYTTLQFIEWLLTQQAKIVKKQKES